MAQLGSCRSAQVLAPPSHPTVSNAIDSLAHEGGGLLLALDNGKPGADLLLGETARYVAQRTGAIFVGVRRKGSAATPCEQRCGTRAACADRIA